MSVEQRTAVRITCDAHRCPATCPPVGHGPEWWVQNDQAESEAIAEMVATGSGWQVQPLGPWSVLHFCPDHSSHINDQEEGEQL